MPATREFDVLIAGGGMAGATVAAALGEFGYSVGIIEPGMDGTRRLAGELVHPTGAAALEQLGLLDQIQHGDEAPVYGFSVAFGAAENGGSIRLPYEVGRPGFAMEHEQIRRRVLRAASALPWVTLLSDSRISALDLSDSAKIKSTVECHGARCVVQSRFLVAADGGSSQISRMAGFTHGRQRVSTLVGFAVPGLRLPNPGFGHLFLGGEGVVLAYQISANDSRVMFDLPVSCPAARVFEACRMNLRALPEPLRSEVASAMASQRGIASASYTTIPRRVAGERLVLVGDAAGCCHPLTATGLTAAAVDAIRLRDALRETNRDIPRALALFAQRRRGPHRTRMVLARALHDILSQQTPEMKLMRTGMRKYWMDSAQGRARSIALLSTAEGRLRIVLEEFARVMWHAIGSRVSAASRTRTVHPIAQTRVLLELSRVVLRHAGEAFRIG
jgi:squalene monooxygenase